MANKVPVLSNGTLSTLGNWRKIAVVLGGDSSPATEFLDKKITEQGEDEPVITPESQMLYLIISMIEKKTARIDLGG